MVRCIAYVDVAQRDNLVQCINIIGGKPIVHKDQVSVEYSGEKEALMIELFEQYTRHKIQNLQ